MNFSEIVFCFTVLLVIRLIKVLSMKKSKVDFFSFLWNLIIFSYEIQAM